MDAYLVTYKGLWLGGKAIVIAENQDHALQLVKDHETTGRFTSVTVELLPSSGVIYNDNGDY
jgi:hypothetical protein